MNSWTDWSPAKKWSVAIILFFSFWIGASLLFNIAQSWPLLVLSAAAIALGASLVFHRRPELIPFKLGSFAPRAFLIGGIVLGGFGALGYFSDEGALLRAMKEEMRKDAELQETLLARAEDDTKTILAAYKRAESAFALGDYREGLDAAEEVEQLANEQRALKTPPPDLQSALSRYHSLLPELRRFVGVLDGADSILSELNEVKSNEKSAPIAADEAYVAYIKRISGINEAALRASGLPTTAEVERWRANIARDVERALAAIPIRMPDIRTMKLRYDELRGKRPVEIALTLEASTYYNCDFNSRTRWRSFEVRDTSGNYDRLHVYCNRESEACESLYSRAISSTVRATATLSYPRMNSICGEDQAELIAYRAR